MTIKRRTKQTRRLFWASPILAIFAAFLAFKTANAVESFASPSPDPGDDWILAPISAPIAPNDGPTTILSNVEAVDRIVRIDATGIETENRRTATTKRFERRPGGAFLICPPVDPVEAAKFCQKIMGKRGARDRIWLQNGDEFAGTLLSADRRRVVFRAFDVDVAIPRFRVRAVRFGDADPTRPD